MILLVIILRVLFFLFNKVLKTLADFVAVKNILYFILNRIVFKNSLLIADNLSLINGLLKRSSF